MKELLTTELLMRYGAEALTFDKGTMLFSQGDEAEYFWQVARGNVKMSQFSRQGREFVQGYFTAGQTFGEPAFLAKVPYPASAYTVEHSIVWRVGRDSMTKLLKEHFEIQMWLLETLSNRLIYKSLMLAEVAIEEAEHRLKMLIKYLAREHDPEHDYTVTLTRQQLADMTGLRVETVIRTIKNLELQGYLAIRNRRIVWYAKRKRLEKGKKDDYG
jgi:CRP/FNR family transcriptional regulator, cyclic AMP receptor protein